MVVTKVLQIKGVASLGRSTKYIEDEAKTVELTDIKSLTNALRYIENPSKTSLLEKDKQLEFPAVVKDGRVVKQLVSTYGITDASTATEEFLLTKKNAAQRRGTKELSDIQNPNRVLAHHIIQSFSPEDNLTPEEINRIGYETMMELTGGRFKFIVATHTDKDHVHNHILINSIDRNSDKKLIWNYALEQNLRMISDRISKVAGAKIIEKRYSYRDYKKYRESSHKFELKQRLYFLLQQSKSFDDFLEKAKQLHVQIDFSQKHSRFMMTDRAMTKPIRGRQLSKRDLYDEEFFRMHFAKQEIESRLEFLLNRVNFLEDLITKAKELNLTIDLKQKNVTFILEEDNQKISLGHQK